MTSDKRGLVNVLKGELAFLENGGYRHPIRASWRPQFFFQDSPSCLNFDLSQLPKPCTDCALTQLTPADSQQKKFPCRHIEFTERGDTLDSLYRCSSHEEIETTLAQGLKVEIARLECAHVKNVAASEHPEVHVKARFMPPIDPR